MSNVEDSNLIDASLAMLRSDLEPTPETVRERIGARLAEAGIIAAVSGGAALTQVALSRGWIHSRGFAIAVALPVGALLGAGGHAWLTRASPPAAVMQAAPRPSQHSPIPAPVLEAPLPVEQLPALEAAPPAQPIRKPNPSGSALVPEAPGLERELLLLEQARTRLSEGQPQRTLALLRSHELSYPSSGLLQERESLAIKALAAAGRSVEAQRRADSFVRRFPTSPLRGSVERAVGKIP